MKTASLLLCALASLMAACNTATGLPSTPGLSSGTPASPAPSATTTESGSPSPLPTPVPGASPFNPFVDGHPISMAIGPGDTIWIADTRGGSVTEFDSNLHRIAHVSLRGQLGAIACDANGNAWVDGGVNGASAVVKISAAGAVLAVVRAVQAPGWIAVDPQGRPWVADRGSGVSILTPAGDFVGFYPTAPGPTAFAFDAAGNAWIPTMPGWVVDKLSPGGTKVAEYVAPRDPVALAFDHEGIAWVLGNLPPGLIALGSDGQSLPLQNPSPSPPPAFGNYVGDNPSGLAIDAQDHLWISNRLSAPDGTVRELDRKGDLLGEFPVDGYPGEIGFDSAGHVWVECDQNATLIELSSSGQRLASYSVAGTASATPSSLP